MGRLCRLAQGSVKPEVVVTCLMPPNLSLRDLIASKRTYREQDQVDLARLNTLLDRQAK